MLEGNTHLSRETSAEVGSLATVAAKGQLDLVFVKHAPSGGYALNIDQKAGQCEGCFAFKHQELLVSSSILLSKELLHSAGTFVFALQCQTLPGPVVSRSC